MMKPVPRKVLLVGSAAAGALALGIAVPAVALAQDPTPSASASASPSPSTGEQQRADRRAELAAALAKELGIDEAKVAAALDKVLDQRDAQAKAERLADLKTRLDAAVKDGKLTQAQADAIYKAAQEGVLPGGGLGGPGGHRGHGPR